MQEEFRKGFASSFSAEPSGSGVKFLAPLGLTRFRLFFGTRIPADKLLVANSFQTLAVALRPWYDPACGKLFCNLF
jgi:hypothetical protein